MDMKKITLLVALCGFLMLGALPAEAASYVGSDQCFSCHQENYNFWQSSGHPYKLRKAEEVRSAMLSAASRIQVGGHFLRHRWCELESALY
jgi:hypothetical protein